MNFRYNFIRIGKALANFANRVPILVSSLLAFFCSFLFIFLIDIVYPSDSGEKELLEPISRDWFVNAFFDRLNRRDALFGIKENEVNDIVIINIDPSVSDSTLAKILGKIGELKPRCIALDIFIPHNNNSAKDTLELVLRDLNTKQNLIIASWFNDKDNKVEQSFFNIDQTFKSGIVNYSNLLDLRNEYKGNTAFATKIAQSINVDCEIDDYYIINYRYKDITPCDVSSVEDVKKNISGISEIENKVFIIGTTHPGYDTKDLPFVLNNTRQESGCILLAYQLSSLMNLKTSDKYKTPFHDMTFVSNMFFCVLALYVYLLLLFKFPNITKKIASKIFYRFILVDNMWKKIKSKMIILLIQAFFKVIFLIIAEFIVINASFCWTELYFSIPNIFLFAVSLLFVEDIYKKIVSNSFNI